MQISIAQVGLAFFLLPTRIHIFKHQTKYACSKDQCTHVCTYQKCRSGSDFLTAGYVQDFRERVAAALVPVFPRVSPSDVMVSSICSSADGCRVLFAFAWYTHNPQKQTFSKVTYVVIVHSQFRGELTFENFLLIGRWVPFPLCLCLEQNSRTGKSSKVISAVILHSQFSGELTF